MNTSRQKEIDLLRGFTALLLITTHVGLYMGNAASTGFYVFTDIFGSEFGAPVFMSLMGISMVYSRKQEPKDLLIRGIKLFAAGYALSCFRSILPLMILGNIDEWTTLEAFFVVDIFQLAGLSLMLFALLKKIGLKSFGILLTSVVMVFIGQFIMFSFEISTQNKALIGFVNLFTPTSEWACFPLLNWFFFIAFGYAFGNVLVYCYDKNRFYGILGIVGFIGVSYVHHQFYVLYPDYTSYYYGGNFYFMGVKNAFLTCAFVCFTLAFWHFVGKILPACVEKFLTLLSKNLTVFYVMTWIVISILIHMQAIFGWECNTAMTLGWTAVVAAICFIAVIIFNHKVKKA